MPTVNPRVNVVMEKQLYDVVFKIAKKEGASMSMKVRDFVKQAVEDYEDNYFSQLAEKRAKTFHRSEGLTHEQVWVGLDKKPKN